MKLPLLWTNVERFLAKTSVFYHHRDEDGEKRRSVKSLLSPCDFGKYLPGGSLLVSAPGQPSINESQSSQSLVLERSFHSRKRLDPIDSTSVQETLTPCTVIENFSEPRRVSSRRDQTGGLMSATTTCRYARADWQTHFSRR
ncbi:unnamed protein product [Lasius platythorax]|uniref:Uncharacterized protein n=1 Tax=Lasius platythorax TaxID=488582 RepID=A0AAV2NT56_9HYME